MQSGDPQFQNLGKAESSVTINMNFARTNLGVAEHDAFSRTVANLKVSRKWPKAGLRHATHAGPLVTALFSSCRLLANGASAGRLQGAPTAHGGEVQAAASMPMSSCKAKVTA